MSPRADAGPGAGPGATATATPAASPAEKHLPDGSVQPEITGFTVALHNFTGPFDLLLHLIQVRKLDVTEVALAEVTDEFIAYTRQLGERAELEETTGFLLVAATLLDLKAARLIPRGDVDDEADLELLSSRDLLFARLVQYRAYKKVAALFAEWQRGARRRYARTGGLEERFRHLLPPVELGHDAESFAELAAGVFRPRPPEEVGVDHLHHAEVSVPHEAGRVLEALHLAGVEQWLTFDRLTRSCTSTIQAVGTFLALLELYKAHAVEARQPEPLGELAVAWTGLEVDPAVVAAANWD